MPATFIIRLQNLPFNTKAIDIKEFFCDLKIPDGYMYILDSEAFIGFDSGEDAKKAILLEGKLLNNSKIKILLSSKQEMKKVIDQEVNDKKPSTSSCDYINDESRLTFNNVKNRDICLNRKMIDYFSSIDAYDDKQHLNTSCRLSILSNQSYNSEFGGTTYSQFQRDLNAKPLRFSSSHIREADRRLEQLDMELRREKELAKNDEVLSFEEQVMEKLNQDKYGLDSYFELQDYLRNDTKGNFKNQVMEKLYGYLRNDTKENNSKKGTCSKCEKSTRPPFIIVENINVQKGAIINLYTEPPHKSSQESSSALSNKKDEIDKETEKELQLLYNELEQNTTKNRLQKNVPIDTTIYCKPSILKKSKNCKNRKKVTFAI